MRAHLLHGSHSAIRDPRCLGEKFLLTIRLNDKSDNYGVLHLKAKSRVIVADEHALIVWKHKQYIFFHRGFDSIFRYLMDGKGAQATIGSLWPHSMQRCDP